MARGHSAAAAQRGTAVAGWGSQTFHPNRIAAQESPGKTGRKDTSLDLLRFVMSQRAVLRS